MIKEKKHAQASRLEHALHAAAETATEQTFIEHQSDYQDGVPAAELFGGKQGYTSDQTHLLVHVLFHSLR